MTFLFYISDIKRDQITSKCESATQTYLYPLIETEKLMNNNLLINPLFVLFGANSNMLQWRRPFLPGHHERDEVWDTVSAVEPTGTVVCAWNTKSIKLYLYSTFQTIQTALRAVDKTKFKRI